MEKDRQARSARPLFYRESLIGGYCLCACMTKLHHPFPICSSSNSSLDSDKIDIMAAAVTANQKGLAKVRAPLNFVQISNQINLFLSPFPSDER